MAGRFVVQSTGLSVLPPPATISSSIVNPSEGAYCTTRFHSSTQCSRTRLRPWNLRFSFLAYPPPSPSVPLSVHVPALPFHLGLLSCRDKPALPFAAHPPIIPNTENTVERYYYHRLFGIVAFPLGLLHRDTW